MQKLVPRQHRDAVGTTAGLLGAYKDNKPMQQAIRQLDGRLSSRSERPFWTGGRERRSLSLDYYRRAVALGQANGVKVVFVYFPSILTPQPLAKHIRQLSRRLGAPLYPCPCKHARVSYYHYKEPAHVTTAMRPAYAIWFAGLIDQLRDG